MADDIVRIYGRITLVVSGARAMSSIVAGSIQRSELESQQLVSLRVQNYGGDDPNGGRVGHV